MSDITSQSNKLIKNVRKLKEKKYRNLFDEALVEGPLVLEEIIDQDYIKMLFIEDSKMERLKSEYPKLFTANLPIYSLEKKVFQSIQETQESQGLVAVVKNPIKKLEEDYLFGKYLYVDGIQDPGNMGGMIRSCEAFSFDGLLIGPNSVDVTNPKVIRSSMASAFRLKIYSIEDEKLEKVLEGGQNLLVLDLDGKCKFHEMQKLRDMILVVGNEAKGPRDYILKLAREVLTIPLSKNVNSLNANVAASIAMFLLQGGQEI